MKCKNIAIMDCSNAVVKILDYPQELPQQCEDVEEYLTEELGYKLNNINWMLIKNEKQVIFE